MKLIAENLGKRFNREWVFRNFSYQFPSGNIYAITGPNGSGKSTLMQVLWGQMQPSAGTLASATGSISDLYTSLAIAAPYMDLIEEFTLEELLHFHFQFKKCRWPADEVLEKSGLAASRQKSISSFSSGMKQRVKLILALYAEVDMLFLDEPCTNLDQKSVQWYQDSLSEAAAGKLVFIASNQEMEYPASATQIDILSYK